MDTLDMPVVRYAPTERRRPPGRWAPHDRPPAAVRLIAGVLGIAALAVTAALLLADRAPGLLSSMFGEQYRQVSERIDASSRVDLAAGSAVTSTDFVVHVALWAVVTVLIGVALWSWRGLVIGAAALMAVSLALELAQGRYSTTRSVEAKDAVANLVGMTSGTVATGVCYLAWSAGAALLRGLRRPRRPGT